MINLANASYARVDGSTATVVAAGANTNGVIIHMVSLSSLNSSICYLQIGGDKLIEVCSGGAASVSIVKQEIYVPAGQQIIISSSAGGRPVCIAYEVL